MVWHAQELKVSDIKLFSFKSITYLKMEHEINKMKTTSKIRIHDWMIENDIINGCNGQKMNTHNKERIEQKIAEIYFSHVHQAIALIKGVSLHI